LHSGGYRGVDREGFRREKGGALIRMGEGGYVRKTAGKELCKGVNVNLGNTQFCASQDLTTNFFLSIFFFRFF